MAQSAPVRVQDPHREPTTIPFWSNTARRRPGTLRACGAPSRRCEWDKARGHARQ